MNSALDFSRSLAISVGMALASSSLGMIAGMAARAGWWLLPAITASALIALAVARAIGRLARRFPSALGVRTYVKAAYGNTASLWIVLLYLVMIVLVASVESQLYAAIVQQLLPAVDARATVLAVFAAVFAINVRGHETSRHAQLVLVALMLCGLLALALSGIAQPGAGTPPVESPGQFAALPTVAVTSFFLFVGFEWVCSSQPGSRRAAAQLPRVLQVAVAVLGAVYLLFAAAALKQLDAAQLAATRTPQMVLAALLWGPAGRWAMLAISTAAVLMAFNAGVLGASRLLYALAREGCLPPWVAATRGASAVPLNAIAVTVAVALAASFTAQALQAGDVFGSVAAVLICICYAALLAASIALARRAGARWTVLSIDITALLAMALLLAAMALDPAAWRTSLIAAAACASCGVAALRLNARNAARNVVRDAVRSGVRDVALDADRNTMGTTPSAQPVAGTAS